LRLLAAPPISQKSCTAPLRSSVDIAAIFFRHLFFSCSTLSADFQEHLSQFAFLSVPFTFFSSSFPLFGPFFAQAPTSPRALFRIVSAFSFFGPPILPELKRSGRGIRAFSTGIRIFRSLPPLFSLGFRGVRSHPLRSLQVLRDAALTPSFRGFFTSGPSALPRDEASKLTRLPQVWSFSFISLD